jgi:methyl coenzyme M reductase subunit D
MEQIKINKEQSNYIEALQYNMERTKEIMAFMLSHDYDIHTKAFQQWDKDNQGDYVKYQEAKAELEKEYVSSRPEFEDKKVQWSLDFNTAILSAEVVADAKTN